MAVPVIIENEVYQGKSTRSANFGMEFSAKLAKTLSATLYSYKVEACIREYATNITDSHIDSGNKGLAGVVHLPTSLEPWYEAQDFGLGMTEDTIYSIFTVFGKSTKEHDNTTSGQLGLGSKSFLCYGDQITVTSVKDGIKTVVVCYKDRAGLPTADTKSVTNTEEGNGTKIRLPVNTKDINTWHLNGARVLGAFEVQHNVNTFGTYKDQFLATRKACAAARVNGSVYLDKHSVCNFDHRDSRFVLMGDVLYAIPSWNALVRATKLKDVSHSMTSDGLYITHLPIGSCDFAPSRESISLDTKTFNILSKRITGDVIKYYRKLMEDVGSTEASSWFLFYKKFFGTDVWEALREYELPFTAGSELRYTSPAHVNYRGVFVGNKIQFLAKDFVLSGLVPPASPRQKGYVFSPMAHYLHQERISRMENIILVTSKCGLELKKKKATLEAIAKAHPDSNTILYCTSDMLDKTMGWFGLDSTSVVQGEDYAPVKVKKTRVKGEKLSTSYGITEDFHTLATVITLNGGTTYDKVDLSEEGVYYVPKDSFLVKGADNVEYGFNTNYMSRRGMERIAPLGVKKLVVANLNNIGKIKRSGVPLLTEMLQSLIKKKTKVMIKQRAVERSGDIFGSKEKLILHKVKSVKPLNKYVAKTAKDTVAEALLSLSYFGIDNLSTYTDECRKMATLVSNVREDITNIRDKLPLWDVLHGDNFEYYLKLEKVIK